MPFHYHKNLTFKMQNDFILQFKANTDTPWGAPEMYHSENSVIRRSGIVKSLG